MLCELLYISIHSGNNDQLGELLGRISPELASMENGVSSQDDVQVLMAAVDIPEDGGINDGAKDRTEGQTGNEADFESIW